MCDSICQHKDIKILAFLHGGSYFPTVPAPELFCTKCNFNYTMFIFSEGHNYWGNKVGEDKKQEFITLLKEKVGLEITLEMCNKLLLWMCERPKRIDYIDVFIKNFNLWEEAPELKFNESEFKIIDINLLNQLRGE